MKVAAFAAEWQAAQVAVFTAAWFIVQVAKPPGTVVLVWHWAQSPITGTCPGAGFCFGVTPVLKVCPVWQPAQVAVFTPV